MLFYCCIYPVMDPDKKGYEEHEGVSFGLKGLLEIQVQLDITLGEKCIQLFSSNGLILCCS